VWSWKNGLASVYTQQQEEFVQVHFLDDYLEEIGFRETTFRVDRNTISPNSIVVLDPLPKADEIKELVSSLRTPVYRYICTTKRADASSEDLIIIPAFATTMKHNDLVDLFQTAKAKLEATGLGVFTYLEYSQRFFRDSSKDELAISNRFKELPQSDELQGGNEDIDDNNNKYDDDNNGYVVVNHHSER
jgi:hypothetical protein